MSAYTKIMEEKTPEEKKKHDQIMKAYNAENKKRRENYQKRHKRR